jgi:hypothetical protein
MASGLSPCLLWIRQQAPRIFRKQGKCFLNTLTSYGMICPVPGGRAGRDGQDAERSSFRIIFGELMAAALSQDEIEAGLGRKGFCCSHTDHRYFILYIDGKKEAATFLSHGKNQDVGAPLLHAMAKELGLGTNEFVDLVKCPLSVEDFMAAKKQRLTSGLRILRRG